MGHHKRKIIFQSIFRCYVSFREGKHCNLYSRDQLARVVNPSMSIGAFGGHFALVQRGETVWRLCRGGGRPAFESAFEGGVIFWGTPLTLVLSNVFISQLKIIKNWQADSVWLLSSLADSLGNCRSHWNKQTTPSTCAWTVVAVSSGCSGILQNTGKSQRGCQNGGTNSKYELIPAKDLADLDNGCSVVLFGLGVAPKMMH